MNKLLFLTFGLLFSSFIYGQENRWLTNKTGTFRFENHLPVKSYQMQNGTLSAEDNIAFKKNVDKLVEWFSQNHPMLKEPRGYDLRAIATWVWGDFTTTAEAEYSIPASLSFLFELFYSDGGKWTVEPPQYGFDVNAIYGGHDGWYLNPSPVLVDDPDYSMSQTEKFRKAAAKISEYFPVYPLKDQPFPGVDIYESYPGGLTKVIIYNPERPPYWLPVTVKEMADAHMAYYSLFQKKEIDRMMLEQLKQEIAELSPEELSAPAYAGHDSHFVLKVNGKGQGLQIMRFNPAYWDRNLPKSAIQFMTFWNPAHTEEEMAEQKRRSYSDYPQLFVNQVKWDEITNLLGSH